MKPCAQSFLSHVSHSAQPHPAPLDTTPRRESAFVLFTERPSWTLGLHRLNENKRQMGIFDAVIGLFAGDEGNGVSSSSSSSSDSSASTELANLSSTPDAHVRSRTPVLDEGPRPASPISDDTLEGREAVRGVCAAQYPVGVDEAGLDTQSLPIKTPSVLSKFFECTSNVVQMGDNKNPPLGRGQYGAVRVLSNFPEVVIKAAGISPPPQNGDTEFAIHTKTESIDFVEVLAQTEAELQMRILNRITQTAPELNEARIHAALSYFMEKGDIPPCIPAFIGAYIGVDPLSIKSRWYRRSATDRRRIQSPPSLFMLMENLRPRVIGSQWALLSTNDPRSNAMTTVLIGCLSTLHTLFTFEHGDLHMDNVLICKIGAKRVGLRILLNGVAQGTYVITVNNTFPVLIDFGMSYMTKHKGTPKQEIIEAGGEFVTHRPNGTYTYSYPESDPNYGGLITDMRRLLQPMDATMGHPMSPYLAYIVLHPSIRRYTSRAGVVFGGPYSKMLAQAQIPISVILKVVLEGCMSHKIANVETVFYGPSEDIASDVWVYDIHVDENWNL